MLTVVVLRLPAIVVHADACLSCSRSKAASNVRGRLILDEQRTPRRLAPHPRHRCHLRWRASRPVECLVKVGCPLSPPASSEKGMDGASGTRRRTWKELASSRLMRLEERDGRRPLFAISAAAVVAREIKGGEMGRERKQKRMGRHVGPTWAPPFFY